MFWFFDDLDTTELDSLARASGYARLDVRVFRTPPGDNGLSQPLRNGVASPDGYVYDGEQGSVGNHLYSTIVLVNGEDESECPNGGGHLPGLSPWVSPLLDRLISALDSDGTFFVVDLPSRLPYFAMELEKRGFTFKYWHAVEWKRGTSAATSTEIDLGTGATRLVSVHLGILHYVRNGRQFTIAQVRVPHQYCRFCGEPLADWGGKEANRNPAGRVISDIWLQMATWPTRDEWKREILRRLFSLATVPGTAALVVLARLAAAEGDGSGWGRTIRGWGLPSLQATSPFADGVGSNSCGRSKAEDCRLLVGDGVQVEGTLLATDPDARRSGVDEPGFRNEEQPDTRELPLDTLLEGDILEVIGSIPSNSVDLAFADPPYNLDKHYGRYDDDRHDGEYLNWCTRWLAQYVRILKPGGSLFVLNLPKWAVHHAVFLDQFDELQRQNWIVWDALSEPRGKVMPAHYSLLFYTKGPRAAHFHPERVQVEARGGCFRARCVKKRHVLHPDSAAGDLDDIWHDVHRIRHRRNRDAHPCQLPLRLMERIIMIASDPGDIVFDGFMGTGSTALAAKKLGRHYVGIEIDPAYIEIATAKLDELNGRSMSNGEGWQDEHDLGPLFAWAASRPA
ncbi:MAG: site-specific DNA-methyltransferase [Limnochordales bacterium]|nr:site-specific DNA-methyltransferase [Limnochordales bacterium]